MECFFEWFPMRVYSDVAGYIEYISLLSEAQGSVLIDSPVGGDVSSEYEIHLSDDNDLTAFFAVGMVINIVILIAFAVWAFNQWNKK